MQWHVFSGITLFPWVVLINNDISLKCKYLISDKNLVSVLSGVLLGIKIHPPEPKDCYLLTLRMQCSVVSRNANVFLVVIQAWSIIEGDIDD